MKIILYGEAHIEGTGAWCYAQTIREMGHQLQVYSNDTGLESYRDSFLWKVLRRISRREVLPVHQKRHVAGLIKMAEVFQPDLMIILKGLHIDAGDLVKLKKICPFVVNINHDDFFSFNRNNWSWRQRRAIPQYDYIFTTRAVNVGEIQPLNPRVELFMFAWYPPIHAIPVMTGDEKNQYKSDVLFIGTYEKPRAAMLESLMQDASFDLAIYGNEWKKLPANSILHKYIRSYKGIWMKEMAKAIYSAKVTLGFLRKENRDEYTQRSFEVPACGGFLLAERSAFHQSLYVEGKEAVFFDANNLQELRQKIDYLLAHEKEREQIRMAGYTKVKQGQFSYTDRIHQLIERYNEFRR